MAYVIFDLDGTVIDSSHRHATLPDGSLDLAHWFENNVPEKIMKDSLLPLANTMRKMYDAGHHIIVCTARSIETLDVKAAHDEFFTVNNLPYHAFLNREPGNMEGDASLKVRLLTEYFRQFGHNSIADARPIMFDDNLKVIDTLLAHGVRMYDAAAVNRNLRKIAA